MPSPESPQPALLLAAALVAPVLVLAACSAGVDGGSSGPPPSGEEIYRREKCDKCHEIAGVGGKAGGTLDGVGTSRDREWLAAYMREPGSRVDDARMLPVKLPDAEFEALLDYLQTLK